MVKHWIIQRNLKNESTKYFIGEDSSSWRGNAKTGQPLWNWDIRKAIQYDTKEDAEIHFAYFNFMVDKGVSIAEIPEKKKKNGRK